MTIQITRGTNSFEYRQREQNPCELEWRPTYRGSLWQIVFTRVLWYNTRVNHIKSSGLLKQRRYPFSTCVRGTDTMSDHTTRPFQPELPFDEIPYGYCHCGCGQLTKLAPYSTRRLGWVKGEPIRYINNHHQQKLSFVDAFWSGVVPGDPDMCWEWQGSIATSTGYGQFEFRNVKYAAHRVSFELHHGPIPPGLFICHHCDNRRCVNPNHLFAGTPKDNNTDRAQKGRTRGEFVAGSKHPNTSLTEADVREIRQLSKAGWRLREIAERFGVGRGAISHILLRTTWGHVE